MELSVVMAAKDLIKKDGIWYYGETAYKNYMEANDARNEDNKDVYERVSPDVGQTSFLEGLPTETKAALAPKLPEPNP